VTISSSAVGTTGAAHVHQRHSARLVQNQEAGEGAAQEAQETPAVTRQEALKGDRVAQRKLARQEAAQGAGKGSETSEEAPSPHSINIFA
jgi:hypothetical protein